MQDRVGLEGWDLEYTPSPEIARRKAQREAEKAALFAAEQAAYNTPIHRLSRFVLRAFGGK